MQKFDKPHEQQSGKFMFAATDDPGTPLEKLGRSLPAGDLFDAGHRAQARSYEELGGTPLLLEERLRRSRGWEAD